jgi:hypothetical protein
MSYDFMVIDSHKRFKNSKEFLGWYSGVVECNDDVDYNDYRHATPELQQWFLSMKERVRPMNGEFAPAAEEVGMGEFEEADYSISRDFIYVALAYSDVKEVGPIAFGLAKKHGLSFFNVSGDGILYFSDGKTMKPTLEEAEREALEEESQKEFSLRNLLSLLAVVPFLLLLFVCIYYMDSWGAIALVIAFLVFLVVAYYSKRWINRTNADVLERHRQQEVCEEPRPLLSEISWNFRLGSYSSMDDFRKAVNDYNMQEKKARVDNLLDTPIECVGIETTFILPDEFSVHGNAEQPSAHFVADDGKAFTGYEILYKLNEWLFPILMDSDAVYFKGFSCYSLLNGPTTCRVLLGKQAR